LRGRYYFLNLLKGSSSGIGQEAALEFAKEGASLVIPGQNAQKLDVRLLILIK
jgi:NAD(P)-dependent dehydrogenase (short-subunit alcohol dehydrogenase family)